MLFRSVLLSVCSRFGFVVEATITLPVYNRSYDSLPGQFGKPLNGPVLARLTTIRSDPFLCPDNNHHDNHNKFERRHLRLRSLQEQQSQSSVSGNSNGKNGLGYYGNYSTVLESMYNASTSNATSNTTTMALEPATADESWTSSSSFSSFFDNGFERIPIPDDGAPIALLAERGGCTFHDKTVAASKYGDAVKYVIVYDNVISPYLVSMSSDYDTNITALFVSYQTGKELRGMINRNDRAAWAARPARASRRSTCPSIRTSSMPPEGWSRSSSPPVRRTR
mgnify:CR=1 FL=1